MSLDVYLICEHCKAPLYDANITHNLAQMAEAAGIYHALWRPEEIAVKRAGELTALLEPGLERLRADPEEFRKYNAANGWGLYEHLVKFVEGYLVACKERPGALVSVSR